MRRRLLAVLLALALAAGGGFVLVSYVSAADTRARAGEEVRQVLVVSAAVPEGTAAEQLAGAVSLTDVPARLVAPDAVTDLADVAGRVTTADLLPGEALHAGRFVDPATLLPAGRVAVPAALQELTVALEPQRAVGGRLAAGDRVSVVTTVADLTAAEGSNRVVTSLLLDDVLVTQVGGGAVPVSTDSGGEIEEQAAATGTVSVTLAVTPSQSVALVSGIETGSIWLTLKPAGAPAETATVTTAIPGAGQ